MTISDETLLSSITTAIHERTALKHRITELETKVFYLEADNAQLIVANNCLHKKIENIFTVFSTTVETVKEAILEVPVIFARPTTDHLVNSVFKPDPRWCSPPDLEPEEYRPPDRVPFPYPNIPL